MSWGCEAGRELCDQLGREVSWKRDGLWSQDFWTWVLSRSCPSYVALGKMLCVLGGSFSTSVNRGQQMLRVTCCFPHQIGSKISWVVKQVSVNCKELEKWTLLILPSFTPLFPKRKQGPREGKGLFKVSSLTTTQRSAPRSGNFHTKVCEEPSNYANFCQRSYVHLRCQIQAWGTSLLEPSSQHLDG